MEKLLDVDNLTKQYFQGSLIARTVLTAADKVSFYIKPAEIFTLAGESGCGKTTTAKVVLGFEEATSGVISTMGRRRRKMRRYGSPRESRQSSRTHSAPLTRSARSTPTFLRQYTTTSLSETARKLKHISTTS